MGVGLTAVQAILNLWKDDFFQGKKDIVEIGSQELHLRFDDFREAVDAFGVPGFSSDDFQPWEWEERGRCCYASKFYSLLGLSDYSCFDINEENGAIGHDLNKPFEDEKYFNRFDVVTDFGCAEHVFNVSEVYRTMHRICKPGGLFIHCQQRVRGNGYYLFEPAYYEDLAAANGYEILFASYIVSARASKQDSGKNSWHVPLSDELIAALDWTKIDRVNVFYVMKKVEDAEFRVPYQGSYMSKVYRNHGYDVATFSNYRHPTRTYVPVLDRYNVSSKVFKKMCRTYIKKKLGLSK